MMNNQLLNLVQLARSGRNPMGALNQMAAQNPMLAQAMRMMNGKTPAQLKQMAQNMAKERGMNIEDIVRQLGLK